MFSGENDSLFQNLPSEMIVEVFSSVNLDGKKEGRFVCRRWCWILDYSGSGLLCFKQNRGMVTEESIKGLLKSHVQVESLELEDFKMNWPGMTYSRNKFPPIRKISLYSGNSEQTVVAILQYGCMYTKFLMLDRRCFSEVRLSILSFVLSEITWSQLTDLILQVLPHASEFWIARLGWEKSQVESHKNHAGAIEQILKRVTVPNLRSLSLDVLSYEDIEFSTGIKKLRAEFLPFIERHVKTLKKLAVRLELHSNHVEFARKFADIPLPLPKMPSGSHNFKWAMPLPFKSVEQKETITRSLKSFEFVTEIKNN